MLNIFPLTFLSFVAFALLRIILGGALLYLGYQHLFTQRKVLAQALTIKYAPLFVWGFGTLEASIGGMFIFGAYTQIAALILITLSLGMIILHPKLTSGLIPDRLTYTLFIGIAITLFITGAGALAFDLPV